MHSQKNNQQDNKHRSGLAGFVGKRLAVSVVAAIGVIWVLSVVLDRLNLSQFDDGIQPTTGQSEPRDQSQSPVQTQKPHDHSIGEQQTADSHQMADAAEQPIERSSDQPPHPDDASGPEDSGPSPAQPEYAASQPISIAQHDEPERESPTSGKEASSQPPEPAQETSEQGPKVKTSTNESQGETEDSKHPPAVTDKKLPEEQPGGEVADQDRQVSTPQKAQEPHEPSQEPAHAELQRGVAFVEAVMQPLDGELNYRFWGWRPNDIINITDNINSSQLGILEVTRRTVVQLTQRISRTGSTDAFNPHLENSMNWLMVKADRYWFPAPESKYKESLEELTAYKEMLIKNKASFYIRTDNLIPLLTEYEDLLGSCDENLVKTMEDDGSAVSFFKADDYFYYAKGVASAMAVILKAVHHDFSPTLDSRNGSELLHHAILSCEIAAKLSPLMIMNSDLDGFFANHRANMAAPISHARFYISQLIKTLST